MAKKRNNQPKVKDVNWPMCFLRPDHFRGRIAQQPRRFLPRREIRDFVNRITEEDALEVDLCLKVAAIAVNHLRVLGFDHYLANRHIELFRQLGREHPNKWCGALMAKFHRHCIESNWARPEGMLRTLVEAHSLLREAQTASLGAQPDWRKAQAAYAERLGIPCS